MRPKSPKTLEAADLERFQNAIFLIFAIFLKMTLFEEKKMKSFQNVQTRNQKMATIISLHDTQHFRSTKKTPFSSPIVPCDLGPFRTDFEIFVRTVKRAQIAWCHRERKHVFFSTKSVTKSDVIIMVAILCGALLRTTLDR